MGDSVNLVNPAYETAISLKDLLEEEHLSNTDINNNIYEKYKFFVSDGVEKFTSFANNILPFLSLIHI